MQHISKKSIIIPFLFLAFISLSQNTEFQDESLREKAVKLFIDCSRCDMNYIRREISFVNYVRDVNEAELYVRETSQPTGSGGMEYTYFFQGQDRFDGMTDTLVYSSRPDDTYDRTRTGRTNMMKMGLIRYVAKTPIHQEVVISHSSEFQEEEIMDKWNNWVFEIETSPRYESEESLTEFSIFNSLNISKITPEWKIETDFRHMDSRTKYTYEDSTYKMGRTNFNFDNLIVKSLGEHWSYGARLDLGTSTFSNTKFNVDFSPSLEYNLFPYSESTHHQLRFLYGIGYSHFNYNDTTIYNKIREGHMKQTLEVAYEVQEKWGSVNVSLEGSNYFHDLTKNMIRFDGNINIRLIKGLSLSIRGGVARIRDQLSLVKGELTEADLLLRIQEVASGYRIDGRLGLTYTFGSIYNNIVNPRFGNGRGMFRGYY